MALLHSFKTKIFLAIAVSSIASNVVLAEEISPKMAQFVEVTRTSYRAMIPSAGTPDKVAEIKDIQVTATQPERVVPARLYVPHGVDTKNNLPIIIFIHGGGFISGDLDTHDVLVRAMANGAKALVLAVDYRLAPEHPYPAGQEDLYTTLTWIADHAKEIGADSQRIAVAGDSAGGNLATELAMLTRDRHGPKLVAQWLMYPTVSNKMDTESWTQFGATNFPTRQINTAVIAAYVPSGMSPYDPRVAPLWGSQENIPPALLQVGELDPLRDENIAYAQALKAAGVKAKITVYKGHQHGFVQFFKDKEQSPDGEKALQEGVEFLKAAFERSSK